MRHLRLNARMLALACLASLCPVAVGLGQFPQPEPYFRALDVAAGPIGVYVAPAAVAAEARDGDADLALWALDDWARTTGYRLRFESVADPEAARIFVNFVPPGGGQYGEMRPLMIAGQRGAEVYIRPDTRALGPQIALLAATDPLFRDVIVYLTCLHELGHALGLQHTDQFADIMYAFGYGGDITEYFMRFRRGLASRADIRGRSGVSAGDRRQLQTLYEFD